MPETLARTEAMPYSFGYTFCTRVMRQWGLDGLDYIYDHPPVSSAQVMHPKKCWEWRDFPVQINLPETLPGGWKQISLDSVGEAGLAVLFGCQFQSLNRGLELARGWDGDHVALFEGSGGHRLLLWASSWGSTNAAGRFVGAWVKERQAAHQAAITRNSGNRIEWESPDGRAGFIRRDGKRVILLETDNREALHDAETCARGVTFAEPPEDAIRAAANSPLRRFNPLWSWQKDGDYAVRRSLGGLLSRHDRNSVGAADRFLLGLLAESRRTTSFHKWEVGGGLVARHESEARRGNHQDDLAALGRSGQPLLSPAAAIARQDHHAHERSLGIRRERHDGWSRRPFDSCASFWPAPPPHNRSRAVFHSCSGHRSHAPRGRRPFRFDGAFPLPRHSALDLPRVRIQTRIGCLADVDSEEALF